MIAEKESKSSFIDKIRIPTKLQIKPYDLTVLKIIPYKKGYKADDFEKVMNTLHKYNKTFFGRFELCGKSLVYHPKQGMCYEILFTKDKITYNFVIPNIYKDVFINKVKFVLGNCDVQEINDYMGDFYGGIKQQLGLKKNWMFALNTDSNINITDSLMVIHKDLIEPEDKVLLQYMFDPLFDYQWKNNFERNFAKFKNTGLTKNGFSILDGLDTVTDFVLEQLDLIINAIMNGVCGEQPLEVEKTKVDFSKEVSSETKKKSIYDGFKTNISLYIKSNNSENISRNISTIMQDLDGDNAIITKKTKIITKNKQISRKNSIFSNNFVLNSLECRQLIKTPSEEIMNLYEDVLDKINVEEVEMPKELFDGKGILAGEVMKGSVYRKLTFGTHANSLSKPLVYISETEGGKSSFLRMYGISALEEGHSIFAFDTIDGKTVSVIRDYLPSNFPEEKIIILDFHNQDYAFLMLWNEISDFYFQKLFLAKDQIEKYQILEEFGSEIGIELMRFIDTFQAEDRQNRLTPAMKSTLMDLAQLVFMNNGTFGMIKDCLYDRDLRHKLLKQLGISNKLPFSKSILKLDDEATYATTFRGIETRLNLILSNATLKKYFSLETDKRLDFAKWANEGYCVLFRIPESMADTLVTFLVQKLWLAVKSSRYHMEEDERPHTHLLIDEPNRFPTVMDLLTDHLIAARKWHLRFLFFVHNMQIFRNSFTNLKSAGVTFIMLPTNQWNFSQVEEFYKPYKYEALKEVEKLIAKCNGKFRYALCSIHYKSANYPCVVKLPLPVEMRYKKIDRSYLNEKCANEYGVSQREYYEKMFRDGENSANNDGIDKERVAI